MDRHFDTTDLRADLRRRSVHGGAFMLGAQAAKHVLVVGSTIILARLLTPSDFGLVALAAAFVGFLAIVRDLGLATATVQSESLDQARASGLFWVNAMLGVGLFGLAAVIASWLAGVFHEPALAGVLVVLAGILLIEGFSVQHQGLLRRRMRYGALAIVDVGSIAAGVAVALVLAWRGSDYMALVWMRIVTASARSISSWLLTRWRPSRRLRAEGTGTLVRFGGYLTLSRMVRYAARNVDRLLIGRALGSEILGLYAKGSGWLVAPFQQLSWSAARVAVPVLSRLQSEPARFRSYFRAGLAVFAAAGVPMVFYGVVDADDLIGVFLGPQWIDAIPIFRALAPVALAAIVQMGLSWCFVARGRAAEQFRWELLSTIVVVAAFVVGLRHGVMGVAIGYAVASIALLPFGVAYCFRGTPLRASDLVRVFARPIVAALAAAGVLLVTAGLVSVGPVPDIVVHMAVFLAAYATFWLAIPGGRTAAVELLGHARDLQSVRRSPA